SGTPERIEVVTDRSVGWYAWSKGVAVDFSVACDDEADRKHTSRHRSEQPHQRLTNSAGMQSIESSLYRSGERMHDFRLPRRRGWQVRAGKRLAPNGMIQGRAAESPHPPLARNHARPHVPCKPALGEEVSP